MNSCMSWTASHPFRSDGGSSSWFTSSYMVLPQAAVVVSHFTASSSGSFTFNEFNGPFQPELSERRVPFRHVTIMDLHSHTFKIQLMSCHTFVLITRFRTCVMSRPEEQLQRLVKDVASRGLEWAQTSVSELGQTDLRGKHMERSTRAIPLYRIVILCLSQPACQVRPFILLFGEMANHLGWGAPKHTALMTCLYMLVSSKIISFLFPVHMEMGRHHATPSTHARTI